MSGATNRLRQVLTHLSPRRCSSTSSGPVYKHELNPTYFLPRSATIEPRAPAVVHLSRTGNEVRYDYQQLSERVAGLAHFFKRNNLKRIAILGPNTPAHLETMFAGTASGGIIMGLNYRLSKEEIEYKLDLGQADCVVADREMAHLVEGTKNGRTVIIDEDDWGQGSNCAYSKAVQEGMAMENGTSWDDLHAEHVDEDGLLGLFFTSGTTGKPKGVEYTHRGVYLASLSNVIEAHMNCQDNYDGKGRCKYLWTLPMFHAAGWVNPYAVTSVRGTHYCLRKVDGDRIWDLLINEGITHFNAAPTVNIIIVNSPKAQKLPQRVNVTVAASPPSAQLFKDMTALNLVPVHMYGLTETYGPFTRTYYKEEWNQLSEDEIFTKLAHQGHGFIASAKARVVRSDMTDVKPNGEEIGEIVTRGNIVTRGYHNNPEETDKQFSGWFKSGDLAVMHPDGAIQVLDRKKDIIITGGENVSSASVESEIAKHPDVYETAVVGAPDKFYGEVPVAFVILKNKDSSLNQESLISWLKERIGGYQCPKLAYFVDELPKTSTGKVRKNVLRDRVKEMVAQ
ncbi:hypothetical protein TRICI_003775 [Trichomonascus ciferrii]|uniref:AMP-dependent synthetase/ligase domain-containing protein n=1 Tax=Trichomonascus ciferrii TaxID=44093 RepID=A0A642V836_9ASCO|nr:hypothetical protein TRICI_003775 [Trichomonascus ciferrii]